MSHTLPILLSLLCLTALSHATFSDLDSATAMPPHYGAPTPHHHHRLPGHHKLHHSPSPSPTYAPTHPPAKSPAHVPVPAKVPTHVPVPAHAPSHVPVPAKPPTTSHPPVQPPVKPPVKTPPRSFVAVQGVVYCKSCRYSGVDTFLGAVPILGSTVKLQCNNTKYPAVATGKTDKNGYFFIEAPKTITSFAFHKCKVTLLSSPDTQCSKASNLHDGVIGAVLRPVKAYYSNRLPFVLYTVGPFAFEPTCPR